MSIQTGSENLPVRSVPGVCVVRILKFSVSSVLLFDVWIT